MSCVRGIARDMDTGDQPGIGAEVFSTGETSNVPDLTDDQKGGPLSYPIKLKQSRRPSTLLSRDLNALCCPINLYPKGSEDSKISLQGLSIHRGQLPRQEPCPGLLTQDIPVGTVASISGHQSMKLVANRGSKPDQRSPIPNQLPAKPTLPIYNIGLRDQIGSRQMGQNLGINLIRLNPG